MGEIAAKTTLSVSDAKILESCQWNRDNETQKKHSFICTDDKGMESRESWMAVQEIIPKLQNLNGLSIEMKGKNHFSVIHPETKTVFPFVFQKIEEAVRMQYFLSKAMVVKNTCFEKQKLFDSCQVYMKADFLNTDFVDLYIDNNPYIIGFDEKIGSYEDMESAIRWPKKQPLQKGIFSNARAIVKFLNEIHTDKR